MCYILIISTDFPKDLALYNSENLFFEKMQNPSKVNLKYPYCYEVATMAPNSCSCHLRIFEQNLAQDIGFCELQDWLEEKDNDENILNTQLLFKIIKNIVNEGFKVDSFLYWNGEEPIAQQKIEVNLNQTDETHFALFENTYFNYLGNTKDN
ncbi:hypothetical protein [Capnocytophaga cynodegmi]|uniref:hypothetical protein n=1 Tax=Capnocytophaga cynodegmi TaxID=28189 RepID=UPI00385ED27A